MMLNVVILLMLLHNTVKSDEINWDKFHQNDYNVIPHRIEVISYNKKYLQVDCCEFVKYNRTVLRSLNASGALLKVLDKPLFGSVQVYKFLSNTYKYFPIYLTGNVCREYERAKFLLKNYLASNSTNLTAECPPRPGYYYVKHFSLDYDKLPPYMPRGDYKLKIELHHDTEKMSEMHIFTAIVDKPRNK